ncbi:integrase catalytic domain-containing protein [Caerostris extrusa]|uniref:Integrase catalytic domain-containing protein n=1 Tax=Caerostris extrusa TaxID=172846 RepID=A0AAV4WGF5_CAEEX|nr:integrase catalytic domain-containing protein [Caerostris extrusa]
MVPDGPAPLPANRINRVVAFEVTDIDLAGPVFLKGGQKVWIVIFTCAVYRAIHLELVASLSTEAFLQAMRRFFGRKGRCSVMYTDNGTNFWKQQEPSTHSTGKQLLLNVPFKR